MIKQVSLIAVMAASLMTLLPLASAVTVTTAYSSNWSGYVGTAPTPFTSVSATWVVPSVSAASPPAFSSIWAGIGGFFTNSNKLVQAGTEQDVLSGGSTNYFAWYEVFPKAPVNVGAVSPGDSITVTLTQNSGNPPTWNILITKTPSGGSTTTLINTNVKVKTNFASQATAEWIVERPLIRVGNQLTSLADFVTVTFSSCTASGTGLNSLTSADRVIMTNDGTSSGTALATPDVTPVSDGFTVTWNAAS